MKKHKLADVVNMTRVVCSVDLIIYQLEAIWEDVCTKMKAAKIYFFLIPEMDINLCSSKTFVVGFVDRPFAPHIHGFFCARYRFPLNSLSWLRSGKRAKLTCVKCKENFTFEQLSDHLKTHNDEIPGNTNDIFALVNTQTFQNVIISKYIDAHRDLTEQMKLAGIPIDCIPQITVERLGPNIFIVGSIENPSMPEVTLPVKQLDWLKTKLMPQKDFSWRQLVSDCVSSLRDLALSFFNTQY